MDGIRVWGHDRLVSRAKVIKNQVMAFFVISISSDSSEESVGTSTAQVILFGTIPTTIPPTTLTTDLPVIHDDTLLTPTILPTIPPDPYKAVVSRWRSRVAARSSPPSSLIRQTLPAPPGLPRRPAVLFTSDDSSRDSPSDPSSETSLDSHSDTSSDSSLRHSSSGYAISETPCDSSNATSERPSRKRCRSLTLSVPVSSLVRKALSLVRTNLSPPPKRIRDSDSVTDLEISSEDGYEPYVPRECIAYADAIRARGMDDRDVVETATIKEVESSARGTIEVEVDPRVGQVIEDDVRESVREDVLDHVISDGAVEIIYETLGGLGHRIAGVDLEVTTMTERIDALELDNTRLRGMLDVESQRVDRLQRGLSRTQSELRQMRRFRFYDRVRVGRLEAYARRHLGYRS
ncbi:hypothetical protein Tco_1540273 [Tanacetum coccineum]